MQRMRIIAPARGGARAGRRARGVRIGAAIAVGLLAAAVLTAFVAPLLVRWDSYAPQIAAAVERATGRRFAVDGAIGFRLLPSPRLTLERARLANREGASETLFMWARKIEADLSWSVLFGGPVEVTRLVLDRPLFHFESSGPEGWNWNLGFAAAPMDESAATPGRLLALEELVVKGGEIELKEPFLGRLERLEGVEAEIAFERESGKLRAEGRVVLFGAPLGFRVARGAPDEHGFAKLSASVERLGGEARGAFDGALAPPGTAPRLVGNLEIKGPNAVRLLNALRLEDRPPGLDRLFGEPYRFAGRLAADGRSVAIDDVTLRLGPLTGEARVKLVSATSDGAGPTPELDVTLELSQLDLDQLLAVPEEPEAAPVPGEEESVSSALPEAGAGRGQASRLGEAFGGARAGEARAGAVEIALPEEIGEAAPAGPWEMLVTFLKSFRGDYDLGARVLVWRSGIVRQPRIVASLEQGVLTVDQARALLPGGGDVALFGQLRAEGEGPYFEGQVEIAADSLRSALEWLGLDVRAVPGDRLQQFNLSAKLKGSLEEVELTRIGLKLDGAEASGTARLRAGEPPRIETELAVGRLNVDAYFPPSSAAEDQEKPKAFAPVAALPVPAFEGIALVGQARIGALVRDGASLRNLTVEARIEDGKLWAEEALSLSSP